MNLKSIFNSIKTDKSFEKNKALWFFLCALVIKASMYLIFHIQHHRTYQNFGGKYILVKNGTFIKGPDTEGYYRPIELLVDKGIYAKDVSGGQLGIAPTAFRMPGLLPVYGPLYTLFGREVGMFCIMLFQVTMDALATYLIALCALMIFSNRRVFYLTFFIYSFSVFISSYNHFATSDSLGVSLFVCGLYSYLKWLESSKTKWTLITGFLICWAVFFRPILIISAPVFVFFYFLYKRKNEKIFMMFKNTVIFFLPFIFFLGIWIARNFSSFGKFIPLINNTEAVNKQELAIVELTKAWGVNWYLHDGTNSIELWFMPPDVACFDGYSRRYKEDYSLSNPFTDKILTKEYNYDSLKVLRTELWSSLKGSDSAEINGLKVLEKCLRYKASYIRDHSLNYYLLNKLKLIKEFIFVTKAYNTPFIEQTIGNKVVRVLSVLFYYFVLVSGIFGLLLALLRKEKYALLFFTFVLGFVFIHVLIAYVENRYLLSIYPILITSSAYLWSDILRKLGLVSLQIK